MKRSPMPRRGPVRSLAGRKRSGSTRARDTGPSSATRALVIARADGRCERCAGLWWVVGHPQLHHRRPRALGGSRLPDTNSACNLVALCHGCHLDFVESRRTQAYLEGFLLRQGQDPASEPVQLRRDGWVYLDSAGNKHPA